MKYEFFAIPALSPEKAQEELNRFMAAHRVAGVEKMFVPEGQNSFWSICVGYVEHGVTPAAPKGKIDYREVLDEKAFAVFARLRTLRKSLSEKEGVPAYALFTNEQLAAMVRDKVDSLAQLGRIDGVGKARIEKYGNAFLTVLKQALGEIAHETGEDQSG